MKAVAASALRSAEQAVFAAHSADPEAAMKQAGAGLARETALLARAANLHGCGIAVFCGGGNNGGDGFHAAACLQADGFHPLIFFAGEETKLSPEAARCFERARRKNIPIASVKADAPLSVPPLPIAIDALLGTGASGNLRGTVRRCVETLAGNAAWCRIVAADIPTGLDAAQGVPAPDGVCVRADLTVTMACPKAGMLTPAGRQACGSIRVVDIGLPEQTLQALWMEVNGELEIIAEEMAAPYSAPRPVESHKGSFGRVLLLAGSVAYPGAALLATEAATRSGVGITHLLTAPEVCAAAVCRSPSAIIEGHLDARPPADAILAGSGLAATPQTRNRVLQLLRTADCPLVLDADALNVVTPADLKAAKVPLIITPHPGELARLLGAEVEDIQHDRRTAAESAAAQTGAVVVLKGAGTLVAQAGKQTHLNLTGNPGMACGGSGDVLAGFLAGLLAQTPDSPFQAACAAVYLHGIAGDRAAWQHGQAAMNAADIAAHLP